jgi:hypothetical protein
MSQEVYIVSDSRTPMGDLDGSFSLKHKQYMHTDIKVSPPYMLRVTFSHNGLEDCSRVQ